MAWTEVKWACEHEGEIQLYGKHSNRDATVAYEAGKICLACWIVNKWEEEGDPRSKRVDRYSLAGNIVKGTDRIHGLLDVPVKNDLSALIEEKQMLLKRLDEIESILENKGE